MNSDYPYLEFIRITKECREQMAEDFLEENSSDLYDALYSDSASTICQVKLELYEIQWLEKHWNKLDEVIQNKDCSNIEKKVMLSKMAKWYLDYAAKWEYTAFEALVFEERREILQALIAMDDKWEQNLKKMKVSFEKDIRIMEEKIRQYEEEK